MKKKICGRCSKILTIDQFSVKKNGELFKECNECTEKRRKYLETLKTKCEICDYVGYSADLTNHVKSAHTKTFDFECKECDFVTAYKTSLIRHVTNTHTDNQILFKCNICEKTYASNENLLAHIKAVHNKIKDVECEYDDCDYKCSTKSSLTIHIDSVHNNVKKFHCECGMDFYGKSGFDRHVKRIHDNIKDNCCTICNRYETSSAPDLRKHMKLCTGESPCSSGEKRIQDVLDEHGYENKYDYHYDEKHGELRSCFTNYYLRFDFIIHNRIFIEYDGAHHDRPVNFGGISDKEAEENFKRQQIYDKMKNDYCIENNYPLLRIPHYFNGSLKMKIFSFLLEQNLKNKN